MELHPVQCSSDKFVPLSLVPMAPGPGQDVERAIRPDILDHIAYSLLAI